MNMTLEGENHELKKENARLREALERILALNSPMGGDTAVWHIARAALEEKP